MTRWLLLLGVLLIAAGSPAHAKGNATLRVVPFAVIKCPYATDNGCAAAPIGQAGATGILYAGGRSSGGMVNQLLALSTNYATNALPENYPGIDYFAGQYTPYSGLNQTLASLPAGCVFSATAGAGSGPRETCTPTIGQNMVIDSYDFTVGGTTCVPLLISGNNGTVVVSNNYWKNLTGNCATSTANPAMIQVTLRTTAPTTLTSNTLDADRTDWPYQIGSCTPTFNLACNPIDAFLVSGAFTARYNYFKGFTQIPLQYSAQNATVGIDYRFNVHEGGCSNNVASHCELIKVISSGITQGQQGDSGQVWDSNTFIIPTDHHTNGPSPFPTTLGGTTIIYTPTFDFSHNFVAVGPAGGASISNVTIAGNISGTTFTPTSVTGGTFGSGQLFICGTSSADQVGAYADYAGSTGTTAAGPGGGGFGGSGSTWQVNWAGSTMSGTIDNGLGTGVGNVLTITTDTTLNLDIGTNVAISGATRAITGTATSVGGGPATCGPSPCTGTGTTGTYLTGGTAAQATVAGFTATPLDVRPGMWSVPGTKTCQSQTIVNGVSPTSTPGAQISTLFGQVTNQNNSWDMSIYNAGAAGATMTGLNPSTIQNFNGSITGTALTYNSGTVPIAGNGLLTTGGVLPGTYIVSGTSPNFVVSQSQTVASVGMQTFLTVCANPTIWGGNIDMAWIWSSTLMNTYGASAQAGSGC